MLDDSAIPTLMTKTNCLIVQWPQPELTTDLQIGLCFPLDKCFVLLMTLKPDGWKCWKYLSAFASKGWNEWFIINRVCNVMRSDANWNQDGLTLYRNIQSPLFYCNVDLLCYFWSYLWLSIFCFGIARHHNLHRKGNHALQQALKMSPKRNVM